MMFSLVKVILILTGLFCEGLPGSAERMEQDLKAKLSALEAQHRRGRDSVMDEPHERDIPGARNMTAFCQEMVNAVEQQIEILTNMRQSLQDNVCPGPPDPCLDSSHKVLNDSGRSSYLFYTGDNKLCDQDLTPGWYRFVLDGMNAAMPTDCVPSYHCKTNAPLWLDLQGRVLPEVGEEVESRACASWDGNCCRWENPIAVRNCGAFFVYRLQAVGSCHLAYCADPQE